MNLTQNYDLYLLLPTNITIRTTADAQTVNTEWRYRPQIEYTYRSYEDGPHILLAGISAVFVAAAALPFAA